MHPLIIFIIGIISICALIFLYFLICAIYRRLNPEGNLQLNPELNLIKKYETVGWDDSDRLKA